MFYSHQLLARKAPLGQIWMAATMHAKMNRRKLDKLNIIKICEEILNPSVPMALRLSGILMGGVVIVYERKVKLLYDDVSRLLVEINEAWKVKSVADPTVLPKGKTQAKYEAVTLPDNGDLEIEHSMSFSNPSAATSGFARKGFPMQLDDLDEPSIDINPTDDGLSHHHHQADAANITLFDDLESCLQDTDLYNRFERFDIEGEEEPQFNFTPNDEQTEVPTTLVPSPPPFKDPPAADEIKDRHMEEQVEQQADECRNEAQVAEEHAERKRPTKRKARTNLSRVAMDNELLIIHADIYQSWLRDTSDIVSKSRRKLKQLNPIRCTKICNLMELPPVALISGFEKSSGEIHYPTPLLELWRKCSQTQTARNTPSGERSQRRAQDPPSHSLPEGFYPQDVPEFPFEDFRSEVGSQTLDVSIEKLRANLEKMDFQGVEGTLYRDSFVTPGSSGQSAKSIPSSGSSHSFLPMDPEIRLPSGRSKRRQLSSSNNSLGSLDPVEEEAPLQQNVRDFKLRRLSEDGPTPDLELLEETGPTQTPQPVIRDPSIDNITESIRTHLKVHFDTPGAPEFESLDQLSFGMNRKRAAQLFYQTCGAPCLKGGDGVLKEIKFIISSNF